MMKQKIRAYYAHPLTTRTCGIANVVLKNLQENLPEIEFVNPFEQGDHTRQWLQQPNIKSAKEIIRKDLHLIQDCDIVISYFPDSINTQKLTGSIGTPMEYFYARYCLNKLVYALTPYIHPWMMALDVKCEDDIYKLIKRIRKEVLS